MVRVIELTEDEANRLAFEEGAQTLTMPGGRGYISESGQLRFDAGGCTIEASYEVTDPDQLPDIDY